ncbi:MAG: acetate--CoA ligase family protein [Bacteroidales bacterium]|nr:acetate--CoA ligase family protein [Bacteroidales bacterium]
MIRIPATTQQNLIESQGGSAVNPPVDKEIINEVIGGASSLTLSKENSLRLLDAIGISRERTYIATDLEEARIAVTDIGFPINIKTVSVYEADKSEIVESITDRNTMRLEFGRLMRGQNAKGILISPALSGAVTYLGIRQKEGLGHLVVCGAITSEETKPTRFVYCTLPVTKTEATEIYQRVKGDFQVNEVIFTDTLRRLSALCTVAPQIDKLDIFPVIVSARSVVALDASATIRKTI